jgi:hypothetical protein
MLKNKTALLAVCFALFISIVSGNQRNSNAVNEAANINL